MKKILTLMFCVLSMSCFSYEFGITYKEFAEISQNKLKREGHKIIDIVPLDTDKNGYVKIIYE